MTGKNAAGELRTLLDALFEKEGAEIGKAVEAIVDALKAGRKILVFGNGGSAAEAQHLAAEIVNKFMVKRRALPAISLSTDTSALTSIANDMSFEHVFSRQIEALGTKGDVALALTTSGNSANIIEGLRAAAAGGLTTIVLTGGGGGRLARGPAAGSGSVPVDILVDVPSKSTPRVQEAHLLLLHVIAEEIDRRVK